MQVQSSRRPKGNSLREQTRHTTYSRSLRLSTRFCTARALTQFSNVLYFIMLFNKSDTRKVPFPWGIPCNICSLDQPDSASKTASRSVQPFLHSSRQSVPYTLQCMLNAFNVQLKRLIAAINASRILTV